MTTIEPGPEEREAVLEKLRRRVRRAAKRADGAEFERLSAEYERLKAEHVTLSHEEQRAQARARRVAVRAQEAQQRPERWRLPAGFGMSPLARERARTGVRPREEPRHPGRGLSPWRSVSPMEQRIWRP